MTVYPSFFDPKLTFFENYKNGPFNAFADGEVYEKSGEPRYEFFGHMLYLPFGISSGPLANSKFVKSAFEKGFDLNIAKSVRSRFFEGHGKPNLFPYDGSQELTIQRAQEGITVSEEYTEPLAATNSFGIPSAAPEDWQPDMKKALKHAGKGQTLINAVQGTPKEGGSFEDYKDDYVKTTQMVADTGADIIEINFSCPNEGKADLLCFDIDAVIDITSAIREEVGSKPKLLLKTAYYKNEDDIEKLIKGLAEIANGYDLINTFGGRVLDKDGNSAFGEDRPIAGISGAPIKWAGLDMVRKFNSWRKRLGLDFKIIGIGGVTKPEDYREYREAGADAVMSAVGAMWNPYLAQEIWEKYKENI